MARYLFGILGLGLAVAFMAAPVLAHHSLSAEFDVDAPIEFTARVVKVDWMNPHIYTHVEVTEGPEAGKTFKIEGGPKIRSTAQVGGRIHWSPARLSTSKASARRARRPITSGPRR